MTSIVLLGSPGAGKSSVSKQLSSLGYTSIITGALYREQYQAGTELGLRAYNEYWGHGDICPDEMTNELMRVAIENQPTMNLVFDGYPRTYEQARYLDSIVNIDLVLDLQISDEIAMKRLLGRADGRVDDTEEIIRQRLAVYHKNNDDIVQYYLLMPERYKVIDSNRPKNDVFEEVIDTIELMEDEGYNEL
jgi:adenylate kinase